MIQLNELISVETPLGHGYAIIFESGEHDNFWTVALDNGALVTFTQDRIRISRDYTHRRGISDDQMKEIVLCDDTAENTHASSDMPAHVAPRNGDLRKHGHRRQGTV